MQTCPLVHWRHGNIFNVCVLEIAEKEVAIHELSAGKAPGANGPAFDLQTVMSTIL